jgi:hypothetical protein
VRKHKMADAGIEAIRIGEEFADGMIREMAGAGEYALFDYPGIGANFEHVEIVVGFEDEAIGLAEMDPDMIGQVAEIGADGDFRSVGAEGESDGVGSIVRDGEGVDVYVADRKALAGLNGLNAAETFAEGIGQDALECVHRGLCDVKWRFPEAEDLGEAVAVVRVLVGDKDCVEAIDVALDGGEAGQGFALAEPGVNEDASSFGFEQG